MNPERTKLTAPERIYLGYTSFWYETSEEGLHDIEYVRADLVAFPSDAQLVELRRAAQSLLDVIDNADYGLDVYSLAPNLRTAAKKLAAVLIGNDFEVKTNAE